jgi:pyridoxal phosphate enzyme (YggS family)
MSSAPAEDSVLENTQNVLKNIQRCAEAAGRKVSDIRLVAVSKTRTLAEVAAAAESGLHVFGENMVQDALTKIPYLPQDLEWHFIGHLQSKKAGKIPGHFQWIHSVDSIKLAKKLSTAMQSYNENARLNCLIQVNVSGEQSKYGIMPEQVKIFLQEILKLDLACLNWRGLMTIGVRADEQETRKAFKALHQLQQSCSEEFSLPEFDQLSMGMSADYCLAIEEGATMVRVGTSIFGSRNLPG